MAGFSHLEPVASSIATAVLLDALRLRVQGDPPMLHPRDEALLREPDGILFSPENSTMLNDFLSPFTIPIHFFRGPVSSDTWNGNGTGVLVQLGGLAFVLTAGHCVRQYEDAQGCVVGVARARSRFEARFARRAYRADGFADYGFLEIPPAERPSYRAHDVFPMKPDRVLVTTPEALVSANDWMVLSGYPDEVTVKDADTFGGGIAGIRSRQDREPSLLS